MLEESKRIFKNHADSILNDWEQLSKDELFNKYLSYKPASNEAEACMSAIIYKSWNLINSAYYKQQYIVASEQDCYDVFIDTLSYIKKNHKWVEGKGSLAGDDVAFAKALSHSYSQGMINFFNATKKHKRVLNYTASSLDAISEECSDGYLTPCYDYYSVEDSYISELINKFFSEKNYIYAFILDAIVNLDVFQKTELDMRKLRKHLRNITESYCETFALTYNIALESVLKSLKYITELSQFKMDTRIKRLLTLLKEDTFIHQYYLGGLK